ncbi:MAG: hypothetical protein NVSMB21_08720 [Vulcanimicrobiaceae bacterium]
MARSADRVLVAALASACAPALALALAVALVGCGGNRSVPAPAPSGSASRAVYTAFGASDAVGFGASVPCSPQLVVADPACPSGTGYVPRIANAISGSARTSLLDLGITSAVLAPDIAALGNRYGTRGSAAPCLPRTGSDVISADFVTNELPQLRGTETLVTIFAGGNDTLAIANAAICAGLAGSSQAQVQALVTSAIAAFGADLRGFLASIRAKAPAAKIVVANLPNFANLPFAKTPSLAAARPLLQAISVGIDRDVYRVLATSLGVPTVDLLCDPRSYDPGNLFADGFHPDDAGYAAFATAYLALIAAPAPAVPQASCTEMALLGARDPDATLAPLRDLQRP